VLLSILSVRSVGHWNHVCQGKLARGKKGGWMAVNSEKSIV
jgi:hypothetical protein